MNVAIAAKILGTTSGDLNKIANTSGRHDLAQELGVDNFASLNLLNRRFHCVR